MDFVRRVFAVTPAPARTFELFLAKIIGERPCALCGIARGYGQPVIALDHKFYHPPCGRVVDAARSPSPPRRIAGWER